jgi:hypothetical protein
MNSSKRLSDWLENENHITTVWSLSYAQVLYHYRVQNRKTNITHIMDFVNLFYIAIVGNLNFLPHKKTIYMQVDYPQLINQE